MPSLGVCLRDGMGSALEGRVGGGVGGDIIKKMVESTPKVMSLSSSALGLR